MSKEVTVSGWIAQYHQDHRGQDPSPIDISQELLSSLMSAAGRTLVSRATRCSFSSAFHLKSAGLPSHQAIEVERTVLNFIVLPSAILLGTGYLSYAYCKK